MIDSDQEESDFNFIDIIFHNKIGIMFHS